MTLHPAPALRLVRRGGIITLRDGFPRPPGRRGAVCYGRPIRRAGAARMATIREPADKPRLFDTIEPGLNWAMQATRATNQPANPFRLGSAPWRNLLALWVILVIGVGEPAACIAHCLWWAGGSEQPAGAQHQHHGGTHVQPVAAAPAGPVDPLPAAGSALGALLERRQNDAQCHEWAPGSPLLPDAPVAVHDCVAPPPAAAHPVARGQLPQPPRLHPPPSLPAEPPFHPPISAAS